MEFVYPELQPEVRSPQPADPRRLQGIAFRKLREAAGIFRSLPPSYRAGTIDDLLDVLEKYGTSHQKRGF